MRGNEHAVRESLDKVALSPQALHYLLYYALLQKSSFAIKEILLQHPHCNLEIALDLAVQRNDLILAKQALQRGADPEKVTIRESKDDMRALLTYARRKNKLYPPNTDPGIETDLDRALRKGLDDTVKQEAVDLLYEKTSGMSIPEAWRDAVKNQQLDIQRAILLLLADGMPSFRLKQDAPVTDTGVAAVMKEIPYFSPKRGWPENFNFQKTFPGTEEKIACRHLVEHRQAVQEQHPQGKFDDAQFASEKAIEASVSYDTETRHMHILNHATEAHLFHNHDFGQRLVEQLTALAAEGQPPRSKFLLLISANHAMSNHAMSVRLFVKAQDGKSRYVAEFFDPNHTTNHMRVASTSLRTFETLKLEDFTAKATKLYEDYEDYEDYEGDEGYGSDEDNFPEPENVSIMFVRPVLQTKRFLTDPAQGAVKDRKLTSCIKIKDEDINATAFRYMLAYGFAGELKLLKNKIRIDKELLAAKDAKGFPGLFMALQYGHADVIRVFGELLERVPPDQRAELLAAKDAEGTPGLSMALQYGHADVIKAFGELLEHVPPDQWTELLAAKDSQGQTGIYWAFQEGNLEALEQYIEIVKKIAPDLKPQARAALLKEIQESLVMYDSKEVRVNAPYYEALKTQNPDLYLRFEEMKNALQSSQPGEPFLPPQKRRKLSSD